MIDLYCGWCGDKFEVDLSPSGNYPQYCCNPHYQKAYRSGKTDARVNFKIPTDKTKLAYLAGLIDSDGHITVARSQPSQRSRAKSTMHYPIVGVTNTDERMLQWIVDTFGGSYSCRMGEHMKQKSVERGWKDRYDWRMTGKKCLTLLDEVKEYLVIKRDRAELVLQFRNHEETIKNLTTRSGEVVPAGVIEDRERIREMVLSLNKRGRPQ